MSDEATAPAAPPPDPARSRMFAERKIEQALMALGVTFAECSGIVVYDPTAETAYWTYDKVTGAESIHVGPTVAALDVGSIEMVLRHEVLHRSIFHGFGERFGRPELSNLTLDVCINRLLFEAWPEKMRTLSLAIYPAASKTTLVALADCTANPAESAELPDLAALWRSIWTPQPDGRLAPLNPASLYFRLLRLNVDDTALGACTCAMGHHAQHGAPMSDRLARVAGAVANGINKSLPRGSDLGQSLSEYTVLPMTIGTSTVEEFLRKIRVRRIADATAAKVLAPLVREVRVQVYPAYPSRVGLVYQLCGVSDAFGLYWNREVANHGARMAIGIYMDVSGSMVSRFGVVASFVDALKEYPLRVRVFDTAVRDAEVSDLARGRIQGGGGTDFDPPVRDFLDARDMEAAVFFTDGDAPVSESLGRRLRSSGKRLYVVYLIDPGTRLASPLDQWATSSVTVQFES